MIIPKITFPLVAVNFKTYNEAAGEASIRLAKIAENVSQKTGVCIAVAPQLIDLSEVAGSTRIPTLAQHVDSYDPGAHTGHSNIEAVKYAGAAGSLINHSEHMLKLSEIDLIVRKLRRLGLTSIVCTNTAEVSAAVAALDPDVIAIEPPELIGTGIPVSKAKPEIVTETITLIKRVNPKVRTLCGAGITKGEDADSAIKLGTLGVLVSSGVVKATDPSRALTALAENLKA